MRDGTVHQRHVKSCPRGEDGTWQQHRCRGTWTFVLDGPRGLDGKRKQVTRGGFATKGDALSALREQADRLRGSEPGAGRQTVAAYLEDWLDGKRALRLSSRAAYCSHLDLYLRPVLGHLRLGELRAQHVDQLLALLLEERGVSAATARRVHATLRGALNSAVKRRLIPYNPALQVELPAEARSRAAVWSPDEVGRFLDAVEDEPLGRLYLLIVMTGLRRGEAIGLQWQDVDLDSGSLHVRQQVVGVGGTTHVGPPKTRAGVRTVPLDGATVLCLKKHRALQAEERSCAGASWRDTGHVFVAEDGSVLRPERVSRVFRVYLRRAGLPPIRLHDLRHTSASLALGAGVSLKVVSDRLGHSTIGITANL